MGYELELRCPSRKQRSIVQSIDRQQEVTMRSYSMLYAMLLVVVLHLAAGFAPHHATASKRTSTCHHRMFTGIVEEMGTVVALEEREDMVLWDESVGKGTVLTVQGGVVMEGAYLGCSICVSGVCLTATELFPEDNFFKVGLAPETLRKTYLGCLKPGDKVNLERASEIGGRNSGHFVQGHVDSWGELVERWGDEDSLFFKVKVPAELLKYIVPKGFVAIDGTSLAVCEVDASEGWFTFMLVEYTQNKITIPGKNVGDPVNVEVDVLGKYSENAMVALIPRLEQLEANYIQLQAKTTMLEARNQELEHKIQSLENVRLLDNGAHHVIPNAKMVGRPEAQKVNDEWLKQQQRKNDNNRFQQGNKHSAKGDANLGGPEAQMVSGQEPPRANMVGGSEAQKVNDEWLQQQQRNHAGWLRNEQRKSKAETPRPSGPKPKPKPQVVRGKEAQKVNEEWLRQEEKKKEDWIRKSASGDRGPETNTVSGPEAQRLNEDWLRQKQKKKDDRFQQENKQSTGGGTNLGGPEAQKVTGTEAQRVNEDWIRQQERNDDKNRKQKRKVRFSGPVAQKVNDEWRKQQKREQERYSVKRVREDRSAHVDGAEQPGVNNKQFRNGKTMVGGRHAKKINDEWLQQTGKDTYEEHIGVQDAVVEHSETEPEYRHSGPMTPDQDLLSREALKIHDEGFTPPKPGRNLDIQDATLIETEKDEKDQFLLKDFEGMQEQETSSKDYFMQECPQEANDYFDEDPQTNQPPDASQPESNPQDLYQQASNQQTEYEHENYPSEPECARGEFNDGWFDKSGRTPDQTGDDMMGSDEFENNTRHGFEKDAGPFNNESPVRGLQPDHGLQVTGIEPDQGEGVWGGRLY